MPEERIKILISPASMLAAKVPDFLGVCSVDRRDIDAGYCTSRAGVGVADVSATDKSHVNSHAGFVSTR